MPTYRFECDCGNKTEIRRPMSEYDIPKICKCGKEMYRNFESGAKQTAGTYPMASCALGGHPDDIPAMVARDIKAGVPTEYDKDGDPILRDKKHRKDYCRSRNIHDRNAGYSDPVPD